MSSPDEGIPGEVPAAEAEETAPEAVDEARHALVDALRSRLGDDLVDAHVDPGIDIWVRVRPEAWRRAAEVCRDELDLTYFDFLSAIDWLPSPFGKSEEGEIDRSGIERASAELEHGVTGGETRLQVLARLDSVTTHVGLFLKTDVPDDDPTIDSIAALYPGADWHERETWEMFGIHFAGHPHLVHIYLPGEFEGHPLRKDFPLLAREVKPWPGLVDVEALPGEEESGAEDEEVDA